MPPEASLSLDGRLMGRTKRARLQYRWQGLPGLHRVLVRALDGNGNRSSLRRRMRLSA